MLDQILAGAACETVTSYVNDEEPPSAAGWTRFIIGQASSRIGPGYDITVVQSKAESLRATIMLAQDNPGVAARYAQACWLVDRAR